MSKTRIKHRELEHPPAEAWDKFWQRVRREGRYKAAHDRYETLLGILRKPNSTWKKNLVAKEALGRVQREFPPMPEDQLPPKEELKRCVPWQRPSLAGATRKMKALPVAKSQADYDAAVEWVLNHAALSRDPGPAVAGSQLGVRYLLDEDIEGCPNQWAWNRLNSAIDDPKAFEKFADQWLLKKFKAEAKDAGGGEEELVADDTSGLDALLAGAE